MIQQCRSLPVLYTQGVSNFHIFNCKALIAIMLGEMQYKLCNKNVRQTGGPGLR